MHYYACGKEEILFSIFPRNSEAYASELLEKIGKLFPLYCIYSDILTTVV